MKKYLMIILSIFLLVTGCIKEEKKEYTTVTLKMYGFQAKPITYTTRDKETIDRLYELTKNCIKESKDVTDDENVSIPKGASYILIIEDEATAIETYHFIHGYLEVKEKIYQIDEYNDIINTIKELFDV